MAWKVWNEFILLYCLGWTDIQTNCVDSARDMVTDSFDDEDDDKEDDDDDYDGFDGHYKIKPQMVLNEFILWYFLC